MGTTEGRWTRETERERDRTGEGQKGRPRERVNRRGSRDLPGTPTSLDRNPGGWDMDDGREGVCTYSRPGAVRRTRSCAHSCVSRGWRQGRGGPRTIVACRSRHFHPTGSRDWDTADHRHHPSGRHLPGLGRHWEVGMWKWECGSGYDREGRRRQTGLGETGGESGRKTTKDGT